MSEWTPEGHDPMRELVKRLGAAQIEAQRRIEVLEARFRRLERTETKRRDNHAELVGWLSDFVDHDRRLDELETNVNALMLGHARVAEKIDPDTARLARGIVSGEVTADEAIRELRAGLSPATRAELESLDRGERPPWIPPLLSIPDQDVQH